jgi:ParB family chromosome partitioning protein
MERRGLGKGLGALLGPVGTPEAETYEVEQLPLSWIAPNPYQPRQSFDDASLQELADSIREHGMLQPIVVRRGGQAYQLVAGERRLRAARLAGLERVPAVVRECTNEQALAIALIENLQREEISPLEAARAYRRLQQEFGLTQEEIAARVNKSRSAVANSLRLLQLDPVVQSRLEAGEISEGHARTLLALETPERQRELCDQLVREQASVRDAERLVREATRSATKDQGPTTNDQRSTGTAIGDRRSAIGRTATLDPNLAEVEAALRAHLGTRVAINRGRAHGTITIEFYGDEDLERVVSLLLPGGSHR